ncbi:MAG: hypothetical protein AB7O65_00745, partial [Candidatus Korobacteraceae bacterium]
DIYRASVDKRYPGATIIPDSEQFRTGDGPVSIEVHGQHVIAIETFDSAIAAKVRAAVLKSLP